MRTAKNLLPLLAIFLAVAIASGAFAAQVVTTTTTVDSVRPGDTIRTGEIITQTNVVTARTYISPGNYALVMRGMPIRVVASTRLDWPPPYRVATEKYSTQVALGADGSLRGYVAGLPFPLLDPNDPAIATKIIWNYTYRPMYSDDFDIRYPEMETYSPRNDLTPVNYFIVGHMAMYNNVGRVEVPPIPTDTDALTSGIRSKFAMFPFVEPSALAGYGMLRFRYLDPNKADDIWLYNRESRRLRRETESAQSDPIASPPTFGGSMGGGQISGVPVAGTAALANNIDSDSLFGFSANPASYTYRFLGEQRMLAPVHAVQAGVCTSYDRINCMENWEIRHVYVVEADAKANTNMVIPRRILYVDTEGWFITASDQYDREGRLWKSLVNFITYEDRAAPYARVAIYPYRRFFQIGMVDADLLSGYTTIAAMPGSSAPNPDSWYINMGAVDSAFFTTANLEIASNRP
jgi:hypothetical protein